MSKYLGMKFGKLRVTDVEYRSLPSGRLKPFALCKCDCGEQKYRPLQRVVEGKLTQCGACRKAEYAIASAAGWKHPLYSVWFGMLQRCHAPDSAGYNGYGARGISVCQQWRGGIAEGELGKIDGFHRFVADMGERPPRRTLGRIDNDGNYEPANCRWETAEQQQNNKRTNARVTIAGKTKTISQWGRVFGTGIAWATFAKKYGRSLEEAGAKCLAVYPQKRWDWQELFDKPRKRREPSPFCVFELDGDLDELLSDPFLGITGSAP